MKYILLVLFLASTMAHGEWTDGADNATKAYVDAADAANNATDQAYADALFASATYTPYAITYASTVTVSAANGNLQILNAGTSNVVVTFSPATTATVSTVRLELYCAGSTSFATNMISGSSSFSLSTNSWNSILFDSWYGVTNWYGTQLTRE